MKWLKNSLLDLCFCFHIVKLIHLTIILPEISKENVDIERIQLSIFEVLLERNNLLNMSLQRNSEDCLLVIFLCFEGIHQICCFLSISNQRA